MDSSGYKYFSENSVCEIIDFGSPLYMIQDLVKILIYHSVIIKTHDIRCTV